MSYYCSHLRTGEIRNNVLHIGKTAVPVYNPENRTKVPDVLFYENAQVKYFEFWERFIFATTIMLFLVFM